MNEGKQDDLDQGPDDYGKNVHNVPDSDVIESPDGLTSVGTTTVPDARWDLPGNNESSVRRGDRPRSAESDV